VPGLKTKWRVKTKNYLFITSHDPALPF